MDLAYNNLTDINETIDFLKIATNLKILVLIGNPLVLSLNYRPKVQSTIKSLYILDDIPILLNIQPDIIEDSDSFGFVKMIFSVNSLHDIPQPLLTKENNDTPPSE